MIRWVHFVARRLVLRRKSAPSALSVLGIAVGVLALIVIISVMNGFQLGFIENILELSSYYVRIDNAPQGEDGKKVADSVRALPGVTAVTPFREIHGLLRSPASQQAALVRGLDTDAPETDPGMAAHLEFEEGSFDLGARQSILLGAELARKLRLACGDTIRLITISALNADDLAKSESGGAGVPEDELFVVSGIFRTGFYEYDLGWAYINIKRAAELEGKQYTLGIKLKDRWQDRKVLAEVEKICAPWKDDGVKVSSWRDYNRAFFGALRTEKLFMFVLVGIIFVVVGLNIYQSQRRIVLERREEIGVLRAVGASDAAVRLIFVWDGFLIGLSGALMGLCAGLALSLNISAFFSALETIVNGILSALNSASSFAVFSPAVFYVKEIHARVIVHEVVIIFLFGLLSALAAAWAASGKVSAIRPAEVLRYE